MYLTRRLMVASAIAVALTAAFVPGSGFGSSAAAARRGQNGIPAGLAAAIHARLGAGMIRSRAAASATIDPQLGFSVALSADGTTALVGAPGVAGNRGAAYIFHTSDAGSWKSSGVPTATLTNKNGPAPALFGAAVALSADGTTAFVGAPFNSTGLFHAGGAIFAFHVSTESAWSSSSKPKATLSYSKGIFAGFSLAVSSDGTTLVAGAPLYNEGEAYIFRASSEGAWASTSTPIAILSNAGVVDGDLAAAFAVAISADGTTALISDSGNPDGGGAYIYHVSAEDSWTSSQSPTAILSDANSNPNDGLGNALALSADGTVALLGAPGANSRTGSADVFHSSGEAAWASTTTPAATLTKLGGSKKDDFGWTVALSSDGTSALVTAPGVSSGRGAAYIFRALAEGAWVDSALPTAALTNSAGRPNDALGIGVLSGDGATALVGAPGVKLGTGVGDAFHVAGEASWASSATPSAILTDNALAACVVPKLKGLTIPAAKLALAAGRCRLGKVAKVRAKTKRSRGRVLSQNHRPGQRLGIGAKVSVKVGK